MSSKLMNGRKGTAIPLEIAELVIMIITVVIGIMLLNMVSTANEQSAQQKAMNERINYTLDQDLNSIIIQPVTIDGKTMSLAEALNNYFALKLEKTNLLDEKYISDTNKIDDVEEQIMKTSGMLYDGSRSIKITYTLYLNNEKQNLELSKELDVQCVDRSSTNTNNVRTKSLPLDYSRELTIPGLISADKNYEIKIKLEESKKLDGTWC